MTSPDTALEEMLRYGMYPCVHTLESNHEKEKYLYSYLNHYLYRDLLEFEQVKKTKKVVDLLLRKEVTKTSRYYFADIGLRNALIRSFVPLSLRNDAGELFKNWFVMERVKRAANQRRFVGFYFWRTYDQHEIDLVEDIDGLLTGFECKWSPKARVKTPKDWCDAYPGAVFDVVTQANWRVCLE